MDTKLLNCFICGKNGGSKCVGCGKIAYCSKEHQKNDWKRHKTECQCWKIGEDLVLGRHLVAIRDIKEGEIILTEDPLFISPPKITSPVCLGCYSEFQDEDSSKNEEGFGLLKAKDCPNNCGFPTCGSLSCLNSTEHLAECTAAKARGGVRIRHFSQIHPTYESVGVLRFLDLKNKHSESYEKLMTLKSHDEKNEESSKKSKVTSSADDENYKKEKKEADLRLVAQIKDFFRVEKVTKDEILKIISIIETNAHEIPLPDENGHISRHLIGVYHNASFLEHNCVPNATKSFSGYKINIRSSVIIKKGSHISISYADPMWGTSDRQHFLKSSKNFICYCARCSDPTELNTHLSSLRCQKGHCLAHYLGNKNVKSEWEKGLIVPIDPFDSEKEWECNACRERYDPFYVNSIVDKAGRELEELQNKYSGMETEEEFIKKYSRNLSINHFYLLGIKLSLAQMYGRVHSEPLHLLPLKKLLRKQQLCEELLAVFNNIYPGLNRLRAILLYELQAAVSSLSKMRRALEEISYETHREELMLCSRWLSEAVKVLSWEPENSVERRRAEGGLNELDELKELIIALKF